ncbi:MAG: hypothetical protein J6S14_04510 [Clostridia bacterium]|nr:hypothetical protein [Clostridia bacterium]
MTLQNSYIFLENPYKKQTDASVQSSSGTTTLTLRKSVRSYLAATFTNLTRITDYGNFYKRKYATDILCGKYTFKTEFIITDVVDTTYLDIIVEGKTKSQLVACLEYIQATFLSSGIQENYIDIISYDAISEYYCNKMYSKLNTLERNLRKLLFNIYIVNFGKSYFDATINSALQGKAKMLISEDNKKTRGQTKALYNAKSNDEAKNIEYLQYFFYSLEWGDIESWLFTDTCTEYDKTEREAFLEKHKDLSQLTDEELRKVFQNLSPKSDWERFFSSKIAITNIKELIGQIRHYRNSVAHFKFFYKNDYDDCNKLVNRLNVAIVEAIRITEEKDFTEKNSETLAGALSSIYEGFSSFMKTLGELAQKTITSIVSSGLAEVGKAIVESSAIKKLGTLAINSQEIRKQRELIEAIKMPTLPTQGLIPPYVSEIQRTLNSIKMEMPIKKIDLPQIDLPQIATINSSYVKEVTTTESGDEDSTEPITT